MPAKKEPTEREKIIAYAQHLASEFPTDHFRKQHGDHFNDAHYSLAKGAIMALATSVAAGQHEVFYAQRAEVAKAKRDKEA